MKCIASSDWHIRSKKPQFRIDDYPVSLMKKVDFLVETANKNKARLLCAGDIFHSSGEKYTQFNELTDILNRCKEGVYCVPGQHDMEHHKLDMKDSPYLGLIKNGSIIDVSMSPVDNVYGIAFGDNASFPNDINAHSVLLMHFTVTEKEPPFFLKEAKSASEIMKIHNKFKWIICGDYHTPHSRKTRLKNVLINCGCIARANKDLLEYKPHCYFFDTDKPGQFTPIPIPIEPSKDVFSIPVDSDKTEYDFSNEIQELILLLDDDNAPKFTDTVRFIMHKAEANKRQIEIAEKYIGSLLEK